MFLLVDKATRVQNTGCLEKKENPRYVDSQVSDALAKDYHINHTVIVKINLLSSKYDTRNAHKLYP